jgi:hypothetical protein
VTAVIHSVEVTDVTPALGRDPHKRARGSFKLIQRLSIPNTTEYTDVKLNSARTVCSQNLRQIVYPSAAARIPTHPSTPLYNAAMK